MVRRDFWLVTKSRGLVSVVRQKNWLVTMSRGFGERGAPRISAGDDVSRLGERGGSRLP